MTAYEGNEPFVFISYAHKDKNLVLPIIQGLQSRGFRVWYDGGIEVGTAWPKCIGKRLEQCYCMVAFVSTNYDDSENCWRELVFAQSMKKRIVAVSKEGKRRLGSGMRMCLGYTQVMPFEQYGSLEKILEALSRTSALKPCLRVDAVSANVKKSAISVKVKELPMDGLLKNADAFFKDDKYEKALELYNKAAVRGSVRARFMLGLCYDEGKGGIKNRRVAMGWYYLAAEDNYAEAQNNLGVCYERGDEITAPDYAEAAKWYQKAAEQGYVLAQCNLGECYEHGRGVEENRDEARRWYQKAADKGNIYAIRRLELLSRNTILKY